MEWIAHRVVERTFTAKTTGYQCSGATQTGCFIPTDIVFVRI